MNSFLASDVSLYELALSADQPPGLQISPATLKSTISAFIDLLIEQKTPAIVWARLPRGDVWQLEIDRYSALSSAQRIYLFRNYRDEDADDPGVASPVLVSGEVASDLAIVGAHPEVATSPISVIQLAPESQLKREYFLIVWSAQFQGLVLAHRPRSAQLSKAAIVNSEAGQSADDIHDRRQQLLSLCSFDVGLVKRLLTGLEHAATASLTASNESPQLQLTALSDAVSQWQQSIAEMPIASADPQLLGSLFTRQLQRQEDIWQRSTAYRKQAETAEVLQIQNEELTNLIRVKDEFLNNVGQELRTPLTTIKTALTLLNSPNIKPPQRQRYMDLIAKECDRQSSLITSLLDLVQLEQVVDQTTLQPLHIVDVVPGVVSTYQPLAEEKGIMLAYTVPEGLPAIACMSNWLKQIVINLLHNGIKFTPRGGQVWVRAKQLGDYIQLEFRDTGVGLSPGEIPKIFDRFYRTRQSAEESSGAGLGLTIVQQLLIHCGGSISVKSRLGEGSTFNVLLPIHKTELK